MQPMDHDAVHPGRSTRTCLMLLSFAVLLLAACQSPAPPEARVENREIILATTTSTYDSGLLDAMMPIFQEKSGYAVKIIAVGTGKALKMGEEGNADLLLVHAPAAEQEFMAGGHGIDRRLIMHNDFVFVGPPGDPAGIQAAISPSEALVQIHQARSPFVTRGDDSGTHKKELSLWEMAGLSPDGDWYLEAGQGMGATLRIASEKRAYTLTDRSTFLALEDTLDLEILYEGDNSLLNIYHTMIVNPEHWPKVNLAGGQSLSDYFVSEEGQTLIATFGVESYGQPLFFPNAGRSEAELGLE